MSQRLLADHLGCDVKVVNRIVNGRCAVTAEMARERSAIIVRADVQGLGKGVFDAIRREVADLGRPLTVDEYRAADPAQDPERFLNRKAEDA